MEACLGCWSAKSVPWTVKKAFTKLEGKILQARNDYGDIEILISSQGVKKKNFEGLLWGWKAQEYMFTYVLGQGPNSRTLSSSRMNKHCHKDPC